MKNKVLKENIFLLILALIIVDIGYFFLSFSGLNVCFISNDLVCRIINGIMGAPILIPLKVFYFIRAMF